MAAVLGFTRRGGVRAWSFTTGPRSGLRPGEGGRGSEI